MIELIPAIDLIDGGCVRLEKGDYSRTTKYPTSPLAIAKQLEAVGAKRLHMVDLDGAKAGEPVNLKILEQIASQTQLHIDYGGGLKDQQSMQDALSAGAQQLSIGSLAVKDPDQFLQWLGDFGAERFILCADCRDGVVAIEAWQRSGGALVKDYIAEYVGNGVQEVLCTDIEQDGMLKGPAIELYKELLGVMGDAMLIASGGVSGMQDIRDLDAAGVPAVVVGKAIFEGKISFEALESHYAE